jgi:hypothetical protein
MLMELEKCLRKLRTYNLRISPQKWKHLMFMLIKITSFIIVLISIGQNFLILVGIKIVIIPNIYFLLFLLVCSKAL